MSHKNVASLPDLRGAGGAREGRIIRFLQQVPACSQNIQGLLFSYLSIAKFG
jgi:hypothetical protein